MTEERSCPQCGAPAREEEERCWLCGAEGNARPARGRPFDPEGARRADIALIVLMVAAAILAIVGAAASAPGLLGLVLVLLLPAVLRVAWIGDRFRRRRSVSKASRMFIGLFGSLTVLLSLGLAVSISMLAACASFR